MRTATKRRWISTFLASFGMFFIVKVFGVWETNNNDSINRLDRNERLLSPEFHTISSKVASDHLPPSTQLLRVNSYFRKNKILNKPFFFLFNLPA